MSPRVKNLDSLCAQYGYAFVNKIAPSDHLSKKDQSKLENTITKGLGVLQENGIYAFFLFLEAVREKGEFRINVQEKEEPLATLLGEKAKELLRCEELKLLRARTEKERNDFPALCELTENLEHLLLARRVLEQMLIYARYHAKALTEEPIGEDGE